MRIIAGRWKRRTLDFPKIHAVRPMMDKVRESVFGTLGDVVVDARVVDLFAGSGSLGMEALSRGAKEVIFVENFEMSLASIERNRHAFGVESCTQVWAKTAEKALQELGARPQSWDVIFIDPPYNQGLIKKTLMDLARFDILRPLGWAVVGHSGHENADEVSPLKLLKINKFGESRISYFIRIPT
jgi:16S rRNA (guanine(966)-N(2))-methyltransferase RsmD